MKQEDGFGDRLRENLRSVVRNDKVHNMYLLTEWEGRTGKYLARGQGVRTEGSEVRTY